MATYPSDLEAYIEEKVRSGEFFSKDDFQAGAIRLYREIEERHAALKADISAALAESVEAQSSALDLEAIKQELLLSS